MNSHNIPELHKELTEKECLFVFFEPLNLLIITPTDNVCCKKEHLTIENDEYKQILALKDIFRVCKWEVF